jgi:hypothetical protein
VQLREETGRYTDCVMHGCGAASSPDSTWTPQQQVIGNQHPHHCPGGMAVCRRPPRSAPLPQRVALTRHQLQRFLVPEISNTGLNPTAGAHRWQHWEPGQHEATGMLEPGISQRQHALELQPAGHVQHDLSPQPLRAVAHLPEGGSPEQAAVQVTAPEACGARHLTTQEAWGAHACCVGGTFRGAVTAPPPLLAQHDEAPLLSRGRRASVVASLFPHTISQVDPCARQHWLGTPGRPTWASDYEAL